MTHVLFVCLGNICRSPMAEGIFRAVVQSRGLEDVIIDSAGTGAWHVGEAPDARARAMLAEAGIDISRQRARQVMADDFTQFDLILAMARSNLSTLNRRAPGRHRHKIRLFLDFAPGVNESEVPDPYYGGDQGFQHVFDLVEAASEGLADHIAGENG